VSDKVRNVAVIGDGSWATAIIHILSQSQHRINWWIRLPKNLAAIESSHRNPNYLSSVEILPAYVTCSNDIEKTIRKSDIVFLVVPAAFIEDALKTLPKDIFQNKIVVSAIKGMIPSSNKIVTDYVEKEFGVDPKNLAILAGPCHAEEVALNRQAYLTIGCNDMSVGLEVADVLSNQFVNVHCENDLVGIEYAAVMKNIVALASGISYGLNFGDNFQAVLVANAMEEIERFLNHFFPCERKLFGSAYLGDLLVTAYSQFSRNRTFGNLIGRGYTVKSTMIEMNMIAEGYYAVKSIYELYKDSGLEMPITRAVYHILYEKISPAIEMQLLKGVLK